jgi:hypothetical protein
VGEVRQVRGVLWVLAAIFAMAPARALHAQDFTYRGFSEIRAAAYPEKTPRDHDRLAVEGQIRLEPAYKLARWLTLSWSVDARLDNLEQVERKWRIDIRDRTLQRPALSIRQAAAAFRARGFTADVGKQFIRWGKADVLAPTDRFAPRDFLEVTDAEFLAVTGARLQYSRGIHALDVVAVPIFTPSRIPLLNRRWAAVPTSVDSFSFIDLGASFPTRTQFGARWNVTAPGYELSASYFDGFDHLPEIVTVPLSSRPVIAAIRSYAPLRMVGGDAAVSLPWFTVKGEAASLTTTSKTSDDVVLYVIQLERQSGELSLVGGYAGEVVTGRRAAFGFSPDRGLARAFLLRAGYNIDANRSVAVEAAVRQTAKGVWLKAEYSRASGAHWRTTLTGTIVGGSDADFFGQYRRNSHLLATLRYSF